MNKRGLSFLSMLVALVIITLLLAIFLPQFKSTVKEQHSTQMNALQRAQQVQHQLDAAQENRMRALNNLDK
ncbi:MAG: type II secretion system protein [Elusimicrobiaceae bacterium]|nr:type II secretion system protein [Elusimicrobiaceae bacterium]MBP5617327.1 type II secretion system protein [Elusimicrobiaceae bacterium]